MSNEMAARLMAKLYTLLASLWMLDRNSYGGMMLVWNERTRELSADINGKSELITVLKEGVDVNEWMGDGRRNWRDVKKFANRLIEAEKQQKIDWMFSREDCWEESIASDVISLEMILDSGNESEITWARELIEPSFNREEAWDLAPNHPMFDTYDALYARLVELVNSDGFEERVAAESERQAAAREEQRQRDRQRYLDDPVFRAEADAWVARSNSIFRFSDDYEDLREALRN